MIPVQCAACGNYYELPDEDGGTQAQCPCGQVLDIPLCTTAETGSSEPAGTIPIQCPACDSQYELPPEDAGIQVQCGCGQIIDVPVAGEVAAATIEIRCRACGSRYEVGTENCGTQMECPCGEILTVPSGANGGNLAGVVAGRSPTIPLECPGCATQYELPAEDAGIQVECPCGTVMTVPDPPPADPPADARSDDGEQSAEHSETESDQESAESIASADPASKKKKKESNPFLWPGIVAGVLLLCSVGYLLWPARDDIQTAGARTGSAGEKGLAGESSGRASDSVTEWSSWVTDRTIGLTIIRPKQMLASQLAQNVPHQEFIQTILGETGADPTKVEEIVVLLDAPEKLRKPQIGDAGDGVEKKASSPAASNPAESEPLTTVVIRFEGKADRRALSSSLLPDGEAVTVSGRTIFKGSGGSLFFADNSTVVFGATGPLEKQLAAIAARRRVTNRLLDRAAGEKSLAGDLVVVLDVANLNRSAIPLPPDVQQILVGVEEAVVMLDLTGESLFKVQVDSTDESAAKQLELKVHELASLATTQFAALKPSLAAMLPEESQSSLNVVDDLLVRIRVTRNGQRLTVQTPRPGNLAQALSQSTSLLSQLGRGILSTVAVRRSTANADGTRRSQPDHSITGTQPGTERTAASIHTRPRLPVRSQQNFRIYDKAYERFLELYQESEELKVIIDAAADPDAARTAWEIRLAEATGVLQQAERLAVRLADLQPDSREKLLQSRYLLAYLYSQLRMHYEAGLLGGYVARHDNPETDRARECGFIALTAWQAAYSDAAASDRQVEVDGFVTAATLLDERWPDNENLDRIRFAVGQVLQQNSRDEDAATWYAKVSRDDDEYASAQIHAGQACWRTYRDLSREHRRMVTEAGTAKPQSAPAITIPETDSSAAAPFPEVARKLERLLQESVTFLRSGIAEFQRKELKAPPDLLMAGRMSLCEALLRSGDAAAAMSVLKDEPWPMLAAVAIEAGIERPEKGVQSQSFASAVYQLHLRTSVALKQMESARDAMQALEAVASAKDASRLTAIYLQIGNDLTEEIEAADPERAAELRSSFGAFLATMAARKEQTYGSLLWVAETATAFGNGSGTGEEAKQFHARATDAYQAIIDRAATDRDFCSARTVAAIRIRLATSCRLSGRHEQAVKLLNSQLTLQPNSFTTQAEAAMALQEWGSTTDGEKHLLESIQGYGDSIWGWGKLSVTLQRHMASGTGKPEYAELMRQARYQIAVARRDFAFASGGAGKQEHLEKALTEIRTFAQLDAPLQGEWWEKIDSIYRTIQSDLGQTPKSLLGDITALPAAE